MDAQKERKVALMRSRLAERYDRLQDVKTRTIGVDRAGLDAQIKEKEAREERERNENELYFEYMRQVSDVVGKREDADREAANLAREELKRDWDLAKKNPSVSEERGELPTFDGDDVHFDQREKTKAALTKTWFDDQTMAKETRRCQEANEDERYAQYEKFVIQKRTDLERASLQRRKDENVHLAKVNAASAQALKLQKHSIAAQIHNVEKKEIHAQMNDPDLCEDTALGKSALAPHRYRPDHFKGFSKEKNLQIKHGNSQLIQDKLNARNSEIQDEVTYLQYQSNQLQAANDQVILFHAEQRLAKTQLAAEYLAQAHVDKQKRRQEYKDSFGNIHPDGYLSGFGTSAR